jgi:hypothetical protein
MGEDEFEVALDHAIHSVTNSKALFLSNLYVYTILISVTLSARNPLSSNGRFD